MMMLQALLKKQTKIKKGKLSIGNKRLLSSAYIKKNFESLEKIVKSFRITVKKPKNVFLKSLLK